MVPARQPDPTAKPRLSPKPRLFRKYFGGFRKAEFLPIARQPVPKPPSFFGGDRLVEQNEHMVTSSPI